MTNTNQLETGQLSSHEFLFCKAVRCIEFSPSACGKNILKIYTKSFLGALFARLKVKVAFSFNEYEIPKSCLCS